MWIANLMNGIKLPSVLYKAEEVIYLSYLNLLRNVCRDTRLRVHSIPKLGDILLVVQCL